MKGYYAVFVQTDEAVEVIFPDLEGCVTCGDDMEDAYEMAVDVLAGYLEHADEKYKKNPSNYKEISSKYNETIMKIPVEASIMLEYEEKKRVNVSFPKSILDRIDNAAKNRSHYLMDAALNNMEGIVK